MSDPVSSVSPAAALDRRTASAQSWRGDPAAVTSNPAEETRMQKAAREQAAADDAASRRNPTPMGRMLDVLA